MATSLLNSRWVYVGLAAIVVVLYGRLLLNRSQMPPQPATPAAVEQADTEASISPELRMSSHELAARAVQRPSIGFWLGAWTVLLLSLGIGGSVLTLYALVTHKLDPLFRYRGRLPYGWSFGALVRLVGLLGLVAGLLPFVRLWLVAQGALDNSQTHVWGLISTGILDGFVILLVWGLASARSRSLAAVLGLSRRKLRRALRNGLVGYVAIFPWVFGLLWAIVQLCQELGVQPPIEPIQELLFGPHHPLTLGVTVVLACILGPVAEEFFFRGLLFAVIRRHSSRLVAMLISGSCFAALHTNLIGFLPILVLGCLLADLYERTGSLLSPIAVHIAHNTLLVGLALFTRALVVPP